MNEIRNVLLVSVDCLREDVFKAGLEEGLFPNCAALYDGALEFTETYTVANTTDPSLTAFMTAKYPFEHGVVENGWGLDETHDTAGENFQAAGMDTFGVVSVDHLAADHSKLDRGFDRYEDGQAYGKLYPILSRIYDTKTFNTVFGAVKNLGIGRYTVKNLLRDLGLISLHCRSARSVTDDAIACLDDVAPKFAANGDGADANGEDASGTDDEESGFFGWVHYFDVHEPRNAPRNLLEDHDEYTAAMMRVDDHVGELQDELEARGIADETLVVFTGDHGEALGEHGYEGHGRTLYDEELNVPLAFDHDALPDEQIDTQVRTIDILPTLLSLVDADPLDAAGEPIVTAPDDDPAEESRQLFTMAYPTFGDAVATRTPDWKLIRDREDDVEELYDLESDPDERDDLVDEHGQRREALAGDLDSWLATFGEIERQEVDEDTEEMLADLGYME
ncbi:sulfatase [Salinarchaeum sp. Harcht-Bsk1]|uniref:sulfatase n=1 Tax=Salinarchaeum sp. Harcht-Bsk1 TaxID=1333523 RepID=UPI0003422F48|nr:sulfatase [Salinarchaeum sp. Harcht-Bsk1]AGN01354.1 sulfatase [Salinarchaeum sp. Harcht-Bsk1]